MTSSVVFRSASVAAVLCAAVLTVLKPAHAETLSLKSGETADIGTVYWISACRSLLKGDPTVEIMEAPKDVTVTIRKENVVPRSSKCSRAVPGGTLVVAAPKTISARAEGKLTVRLDIPTLDGKRQSTRTFDLLLFP